MNGSQALVISWITIHLVGLVAAGLIRLELRGLRQVLAQGGYFACLPAIALCTVIGQTYCRETWLLSAATLGVMIVLAVVDFGSQTSASLADEF